MLDIENNMMAQGRHTQPSRDGNTKHVSNSDSARRSDAVP